ncbi:MAG TPA: N-acetyltransferase [Bauldia sp.]|nr:N-acetyltransferase [Bauldia sp.]
MAATEIRRATAADATYLAALVDIASEGFASYFWSGMAQEGQSPFEVGRARAMREEGAFTWRNAWIAEVDRQVAGALVGYPIGDSVDKANVAEASELIRPLVELEAEVPGYWYVNVLAVFSEYRGTGVGRALLTEADAIGRRAGTRGMAIIVASGNTVAMRLYRRLGYEEHARRPLVPFPGYRRAGEWILMTKSHGREA